MDYFLGPARNVNNDLHWEKKAELNIGLDYAFLNNRLFGKFDIYKRRVSGIYTISVYPILPPFTRKRPWIMVILRIPDGSLRLAECLLKRKTLTGQLPCVYPILLPKLPLCGGIILTRIGRIPVTGNERISRKNWSRNKDRKLLYLEICRYHG